MAVPTHPPFDPELGAALASAAAQRSLPQTLAAEDILALRAVPRLTPFEDSLEAHGVESYDVTTRSFDGAELRLSVLTARGRTGGGPAILYAHGGGMISGDRWTGLQVLLPWLGQHNAVAVTVDYRLAPEHPDPIPVEDCYAGLLWVSEHADELGLDRGRLIIVGGSAGGGLAAGTALLARDRQGPRLHAQLLRCPMLDDRDRTLSTRQVDGIGIWDRGSNRTGWRALLGDRHGTDDISIYAAPARATDLRGLPQAYIDCGSVEVFRDECIAYAQTLWAAGVQAELHVWAGGFHGFDVNTPDAAVSRAAIAARNAWVDRVLNK